MSGYRRRTRARGPGFIESWFGKLKQREVWRTEYETVEQARAAIAAYSATTTSAPIPASATGLSRLGGSNVTLRRAARAAVAQARSQRLDRELVALREGTGTKA